MAQCYGSTLNPGNRGGGGGGARSSETCQFPRGLHLYYHYGTHVGALIIGIEFNGGSLLQLWYKIPSTPILMIKGPILVIVYMEAPWVPERLLKKKHADISVLSSCEACNPGESFRKLGVPLGWGSLEEGSYYLGCYTRVSYVRKPPGEAADTHLRGALA